MDTPPDLASSTSDTQEIIKRDKSIFWKIKGITAKATYRMFCKYADSNKVEDKVLIKTFSNNFSLKYSNPLLETHLKILFSRKTNFVGSKALNFAIKFVSYSTKMANTMEVLKPFVENILYETIIPILFVTEKEISSFEQDPIEFIRNLYDFTESMFQPKNQVQDLLCYLVAYCSIKKKKNKNSGKMKLPKPDYLEKFLAFTV